ncbi:MAG: hypothetical protein IPK67_02885 [Planctomycetes bacterium]|nr:hypothetical protein [Planctomycetota bacterium]
MKEIDKLNREEFKGLASAAQHGREGMGLQSHYSSMKRSAAKKFSGPGGPMDFKRNGQNQNTANCPSADCVETVFLCGYCLSDQIPGNIAFGFATEYAGLDVGNAYLARTYSNATAMTDWAKYKARQLNGEAGDEPEPGFVDTAEDTSSIVGGSDLAKAMKLKENQGKEKLKKLLCRVVKENVASKGGKPPKFKQRPCPACEG